MHTLCKLWWLLTYGLVDEFDCMSVSGLQLVNGQINSCKNKLKLNIENLIFINGNFSKKNILSSFFQKFKMNSSLVVTQCFSKNLYRSGGGTAPLPTLCMPLEGSHMVKPTYRTEFTFIKAVQFAPHSLSSVPLWIRHSTL